MNLITRNKKVGFAMLFVGISFGVDAQSNQLTVMPNQNAQTLASTLVGAGISVSGATLDCPGAANGLFDNPDANSNLGIGQGIVLTTGSASIVTDKPKQTQASVSSGGASGVAILGANTHDACILDFDFMPNTGTNNVSFRYQFGSEEYTGFTCSQYNDVFKLLISGGAYGPINGSGVNIATVPNNPTVPVTINTINSGIPSSGGSLSYCTMAGGPFPLYFIDNTDQGNSAPVYDGLTTILTASAATTPGQTYHLKIAIADVNDDHLDSGIFLEGNSLNGINTDCAGNGVLIGIEEVELHESNVVHGSVLVTGPKGEAEINRFTTIIDPGSRVQAYDIDDKKGSVIAMKVYSPATYSPPSMLPLNTTNTSSLSNLNVTTGGPVSGNYKNLTIKDNLTVTINGSIFETLKIGKNVNVLFTANDIYIKELDVEDNSNLEFSGTTSLRISKSVELDKYDTVNTTGNKVTFYVQDPTKTKDGGSFKTDGGTRFIGNIIMPTGKFETHGDYKAPSAYTGVYYANEIDGDAKSVTWNNGTCFGSPFMRTTNHTAQEQAAVIDGMSLYPNPTSGNFTVKLNDGVTSSDIAVTNIEGRIIERRNVEAGQTTASFNMVGQPAGVYFVEVKQGDATQHFRLVVQ